MFDVVRAILRNARNGIFHRFSGRIGRDIIVYGVTVDRSRTGSAVVHRFALFPNAFRDGNGKFLAGNFGNARRIGLGLRFGTALPVIIGRGQLEYNVVNARVGISELADGKPFLFDDFKRSGSTRNGIGFDREIGRADIETVNGCGDDAFERAPVSGRAAHFHGIARARISARCNNEFGNVDRRFADGEIDADGFAAHPCKVGVRIDRNNVIACGKRAVCKIFRGERSARGCRYRNDVIARVGCVREVRENIHAGAVIRNELKGAVFVFQFVFGDQCGKRALRNFQRECRFGKFVVYAISESRLIAPVDRFHIVARNARNLNIIGSVHFHVRRGDLGRAPLVGINFIIRNVQLLARVNAVDGDVGRKREGRGNLHRGFGFAQSRRYFAYGKRVRRRCRGKRYVVRVVGKRNRISPCGVERKFEFAVGGKRIEVCGNFRSTVGKHTLNGYRYVLFGSRVPTGDGEY